MAAPAQLAGLLEQAALEDVSAAMASVGLELAALQADACPAVSAKAMAAASAAAPDWALCQQLAEAMRDASVRNELNGMNRRWSSCARPGWKSSAAWAWPQSSKTPKPACTSSA